MTAVNALSAVAVLKCPISAWRLQTFPPCAAGMWLCLCGSKGRTSATNPCLTDAVGHSRSLSLERQGTLKPAEDVTGPSEVSTRDFSSQSCPSISSNNNFNRAEGVSVWILYLSCLCLESASSVVPLSSPIQLNILKPHQ